MNEMRFTMVLRGAERIKRFEQLVEDNHSTKAAVCNKGLDLVIKQDNRFREFLKSEEVSHDA